MEGNTEEKTEGFEIPLPRGSVKRIMKLNDEVSNVSADALLVTTKATELFIHALVKASAEEAEKSKRKTIKIEDVIKAINNDQLKYEFLNDAFAPSSWRP